MGVFIVVLKHGESTDRAHRVAVDAIAANTAQGDTELSFHTASGVRIVVPEPHRSNPGVLAPGATLRLLYVPANPRDVIVDETHFGRDFTLWFVAVKLLVCGPIIVIVGRRQRRRLAKLAA